MDKFNIFWDMSYIKSLSTKDKYVTSVDGFSFNGDLIYMNLGLSVALCGCRYCNE